MGSHLHVYGKPDSLTALLNPNGIGVFFPNGLVSTAWQH